MRATLGQTCRLQSKAADAGAAVGNARTIVQEVAPTIPNDSTRTDFLEKAEARLDG